MDAASPDPDQLRASDQDRHRVAEQLHTAAAEGRLTLDELGDRLEILYAARTYGELAPLTRDLPGPGVPSPVLPAVSMVSMQKPLRPAERLRPELAQLASGTGPGVSIAVMGGSTRSGSWVVPAKHTAFAFMGGVELDLRQARFAAADVTIIAIAFMGGIEITVPHDLNVEVDGFAFMGGFERKGAGERPGGPRVRITGFAMMGGVEVKRAAPPSLGSGDASALPAP